MPAFHRVTKLAAGFAAALIFTAPMIAAPPAHAAIGIEIGPDRAPPRLRREHRPPPPRPGWAWRAGRWNWVNNDWVWLDGDWVAPPRARAVWVPGRWARRGPRWVWVDGRWR